MGLAGVLLAASNLVEHINPSCKLTVNNGAVLTMSWSYLAVI